MTVRNQMPNNTPGSPDELNRRYPSAYVVPTVSQSVQALTAPSFPSVYGDGTNDDRPGLNTLANTTIPVTGGTVVFTEGTYKLNSNLTFPANVAVVMNKGAQFSGTATITFNGPFHAGMYQVFGSNITAVFGAGSVIATPPQWWGAAQDGSTVDTTAISKAKTAGNTAGVMMRLIKGRGVSGAIDTIALGWNALKNYAVSGFGSIGIGYNTLSQATGSGGDSNVALGHFALEKGEPNSCVAIGTFSQYQNSTGSANVSVGNSSLKNNTTGTENVAIGEGALIANTTGATNTAVGANCLASNTTGNANTTVGQFASYYGQTGSDNVAIGCEAMHNNVPTNQVIDGSFAISSTPYWTFGSGWAQGSGKALHNSSGTGALEATSGGTYYIDYGTYTTYRITYTVTDYASGTLYANFGGLQDTGRTANGTYTWDVTPVAAQSATNNLKFTVGSTADVVGVTGITIVCTATIDGNRNTAVGVGALYMNTGGDDNTALGAGALRQNTEGNFNTAVGEGALGLNGDGIKNTAVGLNSGYKNLTGDNNVFLGAYAGYNQTGSNHLIVDNQLRASAADEAANAIIYGTMGAVPSGSQLAINALLQIGYVPVYADNAAALAGGLTAGCVYRTGDALKVVY